MYAQIFNYFNSNYIQVIYILPLMTSLNIPYPSCPHPFSNPLANRSWQTSPRPRSRYPR